MLILFANGTPRTLARFQNITYQQKLSGRKTAIGLLGKARWSLIRPHVEQVFTAVNAATPGSYAEPEIPYK